MTDHRTAVILIGPKVSISFPKIKLPMEIAIVERDIR